MINNRWLLDFELSVIDLIENLNPETADALQKTSSILHEHLENAIIDFSIDYKIKDYEPQY